MKLCNKGKKISTKFISLKEGNEDTHFYMHSSMDATVVAFHRSLSI